jgi:SAM-dependent methyltransferase
MTNTPLFTRRQYFKKIFYSFCPRFLLSFSPKKYWMRSHWKNQDLGDIHGYDQYCVPHDRIPFFIDEIIHLAEKKDSILDLGCNCGFYLKCLKEHDYKSLTGVDISDKAIEYGKKAFDLENITLMQGSFEEILPQMVSDNRSYDLIYSMGATIELVHPSFDIIKYICKLSRKHVVLIISEWGHAYPRLYEYEFNRQGFLLTKAIRPYNNMIQNQNPSLDESLLIFKKITE